MLKVWREHVDAMREDDPADGRRLANTLIAYGTALFNSDRFKDAEPVLPECLSSRLL